MSDSLNTAQREAATIVDGPVLVIAGAGTGKTHTLVHRLVKLVEAGIRPETILLLTFTRRAAEQMITRASKILGGDREPVGGGTFHSFANATLRRYGRDIDLPSNFTILDQADTFDILSGIRTDLKATDKSIDLPRRETIGSILSKAVNQQIPIEDVVAREYPQFFEVVDYLGVIASRYERYKKERNLVDFDNLLVLLIRLLEESIDARSRVHHRYRYVMVDEYQDTNVLQARITHLLAGESRNIMVVGDDAQSIYAFRGANHRNLFDFKESFPDAKVVTLEQNYRSTQAVLDVANALMVQMSEAFQKHLFTEKTGGALPLLVACSDEQEQAAYVAGEVQRLRNRGVPLSEIAVLFRASRHAFVLEVELASRNIPYVKYGGFRFMESAHIKDVLAHLKLVELPSDDLSLSRVLLMREGIGKTGARKIQQEILGKPLASGLRSYSARGKVRASLDELAFFLSELEPLRDKPARCLEAAVEAYDPILRTRFDDWPRRKRDLETLVGLVERYRSMTSMLSDLTLEPPTASRNQGLAGRSSKGELVLSTMHSAKGLEWKAVFVIQALDGAIPMVSGFEDEVDEEALDEELRLLYVAVTRAKDSLYVVWPREIARNRYALPMPSRFIDRIPQEYLEKRDAWDLLT
ncbi:MAG TPA: ATP-dependent helicase [Vicinamibacteria bacterium]|nr:ATP-dependent helicase [Vicinamibacteria bacterium]